MKKVVNLEKCFEKFNDTYSPKIVGDLREWGSGHRNDLI